MQFAGRIAVEPLDVMPKVEARKLDRSAQFAMIAAREAWLDAGYAAKNAAAEDGTGATVEAHPARCGDRVGHRRPSPRCSTRGTSSRRRARAAFGPLRDRPDADAQQPRRQRRHRTERPGRGAHPVSACASGAEAVAYALEMIRSGRADVVVCGGTEAAIHPLPMAAFANMMAMSKRNDEPQRASRPYDKGRDGFVMGEGARLPGAGERRVRRARAAPARATPRSPAPA